MVELPTNAEPAVVVESDALAFLRSLPDACADSVITDPPYPEISREYGRWTEVEWFELMNPVVEECRRVLKPSGSAVFILQPNSEKAGRMRLWWLRFMLQWGELWGLVQDHWWWNVSAMPGDFSGLSRPSIKPCVWLGLSHCYRDQQSVLWGESELTTARRAAIRAGKMCHSRPSPSGRTADNQRMFATAERRGGVVPMNVLPFPNAAPKGSAGAVGHGAGTPQNLARWWVRYITPPSGLVIDPFLGSGTTAVAALHEGRRCIGSERFPKYVPIARKRVAEAMGR